MSPGQSPEEDFIDLMTANTRNNGLDELTSRIMGALFIEPREISLEEIAKRTGYSLSAVSTAMKFLERTTMVRRVRKPGSKKVFFYCEKELIGKFQEIMRRKYEMSVLESKRILPGIIRRYRKERKRDREKLRIMEGYYEQILLAEDFFTKSLILLENLKRGGKK